MIKYITEKTDVFEDWLKNLRDKEACTRISRRLKRIEKGNFGEHKFLGGGISELRIDYGSYGSGYRVYYTERNGMIILLLVGGDKSTQERDIVKARKLAQKWKE